MDTYTWKVSVTLYIIHLKDHNSLPGLPHIWKKLGETECFQDQGKIRTFEIKFYKNINEKSRNDVLEDIL